MDFAQQTILVFAHRVAAYYHLLLAGLCDIVIAELLRRPLLVRTLKACLDIMSEISHLVVHPQQGLDDPGLLLLERLFLALRDHLDIGVGVIRGVLLDALQLLLCVQLPEGASEYPLGRLLLRLVEVELGNRMLRLSADPLDLALELVIGVNVLGHGVFSDLDH